MRGTGLEHFHSIRVRRRVQVRIKEVKYFPNHSDPRKTVGAMTSRQEEIYVDLRVSFRAGYEDSFAGGQVPATIGITRHSFGAYRRASSKLLMLPSRGTMSVRFRAGYEDALASDVLGLSQVMQAKNPYSHRLQPSSNIWAAGSECDRRVHSFDIYDKSYHWFKYAQIIWSRKSVERL